MIRILPMVTLLVAACVAEPPEAIIRLAGPPEPDPGVCYERGITLSDDVTVAEPPDDGAETDTTEDDGRDATQAENSIGWFETPCALRDRDPDFVMQVQRALQARGLYAGEIHGLYDLPTREAVAVYQADLGLESGVLSSVAAKRLGLVALGRDGV